MSSNRRGRPANSSRSRSSSRSRNNNAIVNNDNEDNKRQDDPLESQLAAAEPAADANANANAQDDHPVRGQAPVQGPQANMPPPAPRLPDPQAAGQKEAESPQQIHTLLKNIVKLKHDNFSAWLKAIHDIAYFRRWDKTRLLNEDYTWDLNEEEDQTANGQRRDAYWVLTNSMPYGTDFNYLQTGITQGDANALYKKVLKVVRQKSSQNRADLRRQFYNLSMGSTRLNVTRFAAKIIQSTIDLREIGAHVDDDEVVTRFLDGLAKKFDPIVTVERVAKHDFDTTVTEVIAYATTNKLLEYRETATHGYYHMAHGQESAHKHAHSHKDNRKKFKKKQRPSGQYKRWSARMDGHHPKGTSHQPNKTNRQVRTTDQGSKEEKYLLMSVPTCAVAPTMLTHSWTKKAGHTQRQREKEEEWMVDSGASYHITPYVDR